jgi:peptidoglycan/xylan/chitin deacetylase (PgdA/CDA1 family)
LILEKQSEVRFYSINVWLLSILIVFLLLLGIQQFDFKNELHAQPLSDSATNDKVVILNFDDGRKTQFTQAKPILLMG